MSSMTLIVFPVCATLAAVAMADAAEVQTHPFSVRDMLAMDRISGPAASPDGKQIVFSLRTTDLEANKGRTDLWLIGSDGGGLRRLTANPNSLAAAWAPDGSTIYFLSTRSGSQQVWKIGVSGGEATQVTNLPLDVGAFRMSPDGTKLAIALEVFPDASSAADTRKRLDELGKQKATGRVYDRLFIRHWDTWKDGRRNHVFIMPIAGGDEPIPLMKGMDADCPTKPFGGVEDFAFTPDGKGVVFAARDAGREEAWSTRFDLYLAPADGSAQPQKLIDNGGATLAMPTFSPDGRTLAYLAMKRPGYESDRFRIMLMSWPDGEPRALTETWDRSPHAITWSPDSRTIYTAADHIGNHPLFAISTATGEVQQLVEQGHVREVVAAGERVVYGLDHLRSPVELYSISPTGGDVRQITSLNKDKIAAARMGEPEQFSFKGWNDETVYGYVVKPADFDPARKYPVAFLIHGGPQGSFGNDFHYRWNPQAYAGAGYAAVMIDFHGSTGYGQAFTDAINGHWGDRPLEDLQKGLQFAIGRYPWLDGDRVAALGASFGGYMINWIAGNWPDRFRCLVCHDGNLDERMAYYDTEELWFPEWEHGGPPWAEGATYGHHNPIDHVHKWKTPMLVIHGALDFRVVDTQGMSTFTALQRRGIPSRFLWFPDENHWVLKPHNSILWHETVIGWLDQWCKGSEGGPAGRAERAR